jgi:ATP adenylyltransferase
MDKLWAPWRIKYISALNKKKGCIFCHAQSGKTEDQVVFKTKYSVVMLNIFPYNNGHILIAPRAHIRDIAQLNDAQLLDLMHSLNKAKSLLEKTLKPDGFNIGINLGRAAGAGITAHMHLHIVPRWVGDTNFISTIAGTKVISQSLEELLKLLKKCLKQEK